MKAVILAGGLGTRISEESSLRPKPMIEVGGRPILWHIMKIYHHYGIDDFIICLGYRGYSIKEYFANYFMHNSDFTIDGRSQNITFHGSKAESWRVTLVDTGEASQTGGRLRRVASYLDPAEPFCFTYGDGVADVDITALLAFHKAHGRKATLTAVMPPGRYGSLSIEGDAVLRFLEKPPGDNAYINGGFFVLDPSVIGYIDGDERSWESEPLERLAAEGQLRAYRHFGFWQPMDTLRDKNRLEELWSRGDAPWKVWHDVSAAIDRPFWDGRRVLITGHTGFKGAWLALWLHEMGARVHGFALPPRTDPALFSLLHLRDRIASREGDLRDLAQVRDAVRAAEPDIVFHLAAQALVIDSIADPVGTMATNVMGTVHLLEAIREQPGISAVLTVTSDKVYANDESGAAFSEDVPLGGKDPYSASKAAAELVVRAYRETFLAKGGVRAATARGGNVVGGGDYATDRIVPDVVRAVQAGTSPVLRMPAATRPWQHVLDCLAGYIQYAQALARGAPVPAALNFGPHPHEAITVEEVATTIMAALGAEPAYRHEPVPGSIEMKTLAVDATLARASLGWGDRLPGRRAIEWTAQWYHRVHEGADPLAVTLEQIRAFGL